MKSRGCRTNRQGLMSVFVVAVLDPGRMKDIHMYSGSNQCARISCIQNFHLIAEDWSIRHFCSCMLSNSSTLSTCNASSVVVKQSDWMQSVLDRIVKQREGREIDVSSSCQGAAPHHSAGTAIFQCTSACLKFLWSPAVGRWED